ncbi:MAG: CocE/NonD family hydrolase [Bacteroidia bacterium]|nr:CocE/NonD family hydrolase [Bacteroidia bacterium]
MRKLSFLLILLLPLSYYAQQSDSAYIAQNYFKKVVDIPMRDGVKLHTIIYQPMEAMDTYPILMKRTCYGIPPYEPEVMPTRLGPSRYLMREGYIFVYQDVRGRWKSEGEWDNMRPNIPGNNPRKKKDIDESSDTYDTIEWLITNLENSNDRVGQWGISYPGYFTAASLPDAHPNLVASSPQAPISDFFFDDFHHMGAYLESYSMTFPVFGEQTKEPTTKSWYGDVWDELYNVGNRNDGYEYYKKLGSLKNLTEKYYKDNFFWQQIVEHPNYDEFWQKRSILPHLNNVNHAVMTVGGWFDAEDLYGPLNIYKTIEKKSPSKNNTIVMGPWSHGDWSRERGYQSVNHIYFGDSLSTFYQKNIEKPFFDYHLKGKGDLDLPEAYMFDTGLKAWKKFSAWPPLDIPAVQLGFAPGGKLLIDQKGSDEHVFDYISDPDKPVPYRSEREAVRFTPRPYMTDDQRHASRRPDVLTFETEVLGDNKTLAGEILVALKVALSTTDADFVVKLIDVYPEDEPATKATPEHIEMGGYQQLVRAEVFRGRFRNSFEKPEPFTPGQPEEVKFPLQDILHTFKKGHKIMIQIHSTWFPYIDRNPQKYVDNIYMADEGDFVKSEIKVYGSSTVTIGEEVKLEIVPANKD